MNPLDAMNPKTLHHLYQCYLEQGQLVSTDTRKLPAGCLFFALKGPNFNGNLFAQQALENGAAYAIVDEPLPTGADPARFILVKDGLQALQALANHHRKQFSIPVLGITGSNGKTTTKELVAKVLAKKWLTHATAGNFNNHIGVPLTLLAMPLNTEIAVIEMGDNQLGDLTEICKIAEPTHGLITNIGKDHIEGYGDFEGNIRAKSELYHYLIQKGGIGFVPAFDPILVNMAKRFQAPVFYGNEASGIAPELLNALPFVAYKNAQGKEVTTQLAGKYNFWNVLAAEKLGRYFRVVSKDIDEAIAAYKPENNRSQVIKTTRNTIFLDAYNANPSSVSVALESLAEWKTADKKMVILGDMLELGNISTEEHRAMVAKTSNMPFDECLFCGSAYFEVKQSSDKGYFFKDKTALEDYLKTNAPQSMLIMLKGSRGLQLEKLLPLL